MFADPQFWVAVSFFLFIGAIFNPVRKILTSSLDNQINEIKNKIKEAEKIKNEAQNTLSELKKREEEVEKEIRELKFNSEKKILELKDLSSKKLSEQINKRKLQAEDKIDQLVREMNFSIKNFITSAAIDATIDLINKNLSQEKKSKLIGESIKELNNVLKN
ncbi:MAG: hypothetical protein CMG00_00790 [Candidatus Marinimicrobia bacterium]|nr:hypothetical protein [Candidatus Neomarinimicrobiota bacterium]